MTMPRTTDPVVPLLLLLSATTGLVDAVSVLGLGKVFTANMTGNVGVPRLRAGGRAGLFLAALRGGARLLRAGGDRRRSARPDA